MDLFLSGSFIYYIFFKKKKNVDVDAEQVNCLLLVVFGRLANLERERERQREREHFD